MGEYSHAFKKVDVSIFWTIKMMVCQKDLLVYTVALRHLCGDRGIHRSSRRTDNGSLNMSNRPL